MTVPFLDLKAQHAALHDALTAVFERLLSSCAFASGPEVEAFERAFASYCGARHCVGVGSGTAALELLLRAHGIGPGDEVITVANTFIATAEAVSLVGARPVFTDVLESTALLDPASLEAVITPKTKAIIPVHLFGQPADMEPILAVARQHHLLVFEDSCQAHGARYYGKRTGALADGAAFSFYPGKNLGACGEAGAVTTEDPAIAEKIRMLRDHGSRRKYEHEIVGRNDRMDGIQGAILATKLPHLDGWNERRRNRAQLYRRLLKDVPARGTVGLDRRAVRLVEEAPECESVYHLFVVRTGNRDRVRAKLEERGIATGIHYPHPLHLLPAYAHLGYRRGDFPVCERLADEIISLPMFPELTDEQVTSVMEALRSATGGRPSTPLRVNDRRGSAVA